jgi:hypothetical protein
MKLFPLPGAQIFVAGLGSVTNKCESRAGVVFRASGTNPAQWGLRSNACWFPATCRDRISWCRTAAPSPDCPARACLFANANLDRFAAGDRLWASPCSSRGLSADQPLLDALAAVADLLDGFLHGGLRSPTLLCLIADFVILPAGDARPVLLAAAFVFFAAFFAIASSLIKSPTALCDASSERRNVRSSSAVRRTCVQEFCVCVPAPRSPPPSPTIGAFQKRHKLPGGRTDRRKAEIEWRGRAEVGWNSHICSPDRAVLSHQAPGVLVEASTLTAGQT